MKRFIGCILIGFILIIGLGIDVVQAAPIAVSVQADDFGEIVVGSGARANFTVTLESDAPMVCTGNSLIPIGFAVESLDAPVGVLVAPVDGGTNFTIDAGGYTAANPFMKSQSGQVQVAFGAPYDPQDAQDVMTFNLVAAFDGAAVESCLAAEWQMATGTDSIEITVRDAPAPSGQQQVEGPTSPQDNSSAPTESAAGVDFVLIVMAVGVAVLRRAKR